MKRTYGDIKNQAKARMTGSFGDAFIIAVIPGLIVYGINLFIKIFTNFIDPTAKVIIDNVFDLIFTTLASYVVIHLVLKYVRGKSGVRFDEMFSFDNRTLKFFGYQFVISLISLLCFIPLLPYFVEYLNDIQYLANTESIWNYLETSGFIEDIANAVYLSLGLLLVFSFISVRISFASYLIIDKDMGIFEAMAKSWTLTKGNWFRVFFFGLSFIGWILLGILTCGILLIVYVSPYMTVAKAYLYTNLLEENGDNVDYNEFKTDQKQALKPTVLSGSDPLDTTPIFDDKDEFDYYK